MKDVILNLFQDLCKGYLLETCAYFTINAVVRTEVLTGVLDKNYVKLASEEFIL